MLIAESIKESCHSWICGFWASLVGFSGFDATGKEIFRHIGFSPESEVVKQLSKMGVVK